MPETGQDRPAANPSPPGTPTPGVRNTNEEFEASFTRLERFALDVTDRVGSVGFFLIVMGWSLLWLLWNTLAPRGYRFDPAPAFVMWLFISNAIQLTLMPLIMVGQNLQSRHAELRAQADYEINRRAEEVGERILAHLDAHATELQEMREALRKGDLTPGPFPTREGAGGQVPPAST